MSDQMNGNQNHKNGLGPVTREKYEKIIRERISRRIKALESQIEAHRDDALDTYLKKEGLHDKLVRCRSAFRELEAVFDTDNYIRASWLESDRELYGTRTVRPDVDSILRGKTVLKPASLQNTLRDERIQIQLAAGHTIRWSDWRGSPFGYGP